MVVVVIPGVCWITGLFGKDEDGLLILICCGIPLFAFPIALGLSNRTKKQTQINNNQHLHKQTATFLSGQSIRVIKQDLVTTWLSLSLTRDNLDQITPCILGDGALNKIVRLSRSTNPHLYILSLKYIYRVGLGLRNSCWLAGDGLGYSRLL